MPDPPPGYGQWGPGVGQQRQDVRIALLEDRQNRYDASVLSILGKLDALERGVAALRSDHYEQIEKLHDRITAEKNKAHDDIWDELRAQQERMDTLKNLVIAALASGIFAAILALINRVSAAGHP